MFEKGAPFPQLRDRLHRLSWLLSNAGTEVIYLVLTIVGAGLAGGLMWTLGLNGESLAKALVIHPPAILYSLLVSGFIVTVVPVRDLIGAEVFRNMLFGRYHRPLEEERIFLFIDLTGCTAYAQAHGDRQAQTYLGAYLATTPQM